jgi:hypothetical protein
MRTRVRWILYLVVFAVGVIVGLFGHVIPALVRRTSQPPIEVRGQTAVRPRSTNVWGTLEALRIPLENSADFFPDRVVRLQPARWFFEGFNESALSNFLNQCELTRAQAGDLLDTNHWQTASNGLIVIPSDIVIRTLSSPSRAQIYGALARSVENYSQRFPFRFRESEFTNVFAGSALPPEKLRLIKDLSYTDRGSLCFTDVQALPAVLSSNEFHEAVCYLYATPAYRLRLRIYPESDIGPLVKYWSRGRGAEKIKPLIESLTRLPNPDGASINISYLLPAFARLRLYTFPKAWAEPQAGKEDCFWTSMNFFNEEPDMRFLDGNYVRQVLKTDYHVVRDRPTYGDLVTLVGPNGDGRHMCVYIAEDFVYTKNGMNELCPWVLMKVPDMLAAFTSHDEQRMVIVRRNDIGTNSGAAVLPGG